MKKDSIVGGELLFVSMRCAILKLNPFFLYRNFIIFLVELSAIFTTVFAIDCWIHGQAYFFNLHLSFWLWFTVLFANFAESFAEFKGKFQADRLKKGRSEVYARRLTSTNGIELIPSLLLRKGDVVEIVDDMIVPSDGEIVEGVALMDESAITGESAPVVREFGSDKTGVTGGTRVLSGMIRVKIGANAGETFVDQMIGMIASVRRDKTPNEKALEIFLISSTVMFIVVVLTLPVFSGYLYFKIPTTLLIALLICLIPTTIGGLLPVVGIAGMDRLLAKNVIALNSRAVEAAGDVNVVFLDKTGTITLGNRLAIKFTPAPGIMEKELAHFALLSSLADETPEGRSIVVLAKEILKMRGRDVKSMEDFKFIEFSPDTRMSGINVGDNQIRKGAADALENFVRSRQIKFPYEIKYEVKRIAREGGTPLVVADSTKVYGVIYLRDVLKKGIRDKLLKLKKAGVISVMVTGDNQLTAAAIAAEAGVSDFIAEATPSIKLKRIKKYQEDGYMVAMIGDGVNDAPALAQADVAVAMNIGTQSAREAANMIDLDSNPTKLLDIITIGKQILITRGALTTFSIANDVSKYFAILPAIFVGSYPELNRFNIMGLATPSSAIISAIIFNALIIPALIPLALKGVSYSQSPAIATLRRNLLLYGLGGIIFPFICIKLIDLLVIFLGLV